MYLFAFMCLETDNGSGMLCCLFGNIFLQITIGYRSFISERFVEFNNKVNAARKSKVDDNTARMQSIKQLGV